MAVCSGMNNCHIATDELLNTDKLHGDSSEDQGDETTPTTTASDCSDIARDDELESIAKEHEEIPDERQPCRQSGPGPAPPSDEAAPRQLGPGTYHGEAGVPPYAPPMPMSRLPAEEDSACAAQRDDCGSSLTGAPVEHFRAEETVFIFDWDDTVLPSTWVQGQGLRLDEGSDLSPWQREQLAEVASVTAETLRVAKQHGTVVLVTNAERGWIELSCAKFLPTLSPALENVKLLSARTTYESHQYAPSPLDWKLRAFESEIARIFGSETLTEPSRRKNVLSLGDSVHEREALLRATGSLPNCRSKSLKFVERPDIGQICKQHTLVTNCFDKIVHHDGNLDLCIRCA